MLRNLQSRAWLPLIVILAVRFAVGLTYSLITPAWESYDEDGHFAYARYLAKYRTLLQPGTPEAEQVWEKFQPPLYYLLVAPAITGLDLGQKFQIPERNPYFVSGNAGVNYSLHPDQLVGEERSIDIALHVARVVSVIISTASVVFVYLIGRRLWPAQTSTVWTLTLAYAFWPQFLFVGSMVTNDVLVTALSALLGYLTIELASQGFRRGLALALGLTLAAALLTKLNAVAFIAPALVAVFLSLAHNPKPWRLPRTWLPLVGLGLLVVIALWLLNSFKFVTGHVLRPITLIRFLKSTFALNAAGQVSSQFILPALTYGFRTFLASFGWGNLETYPWLYGVWTVGAGLSLILIIRHVIRSLRQRQRQALGLFVLLGLQILGLTAATLFIAITYRNIYLFPGRYLLPALPAVLLLFIGSWQALVPQKLKGYLWKIISLGLVLVGWSIPFTTLAPAYAKPQPLENLARLDYPLHVFFNQEIELLGAIRPQPIYPDDNLVVSLCWQARTPVTKNYSVSLEVIGPDGEGYGQLETYPGRGNYPTSFWTVNQPFCDEYKIHVRGDVPAPAAATVRVLLLDGVHGDPLGVTNASGEVLNPNLITLPSKIRANDRQRVTPSHLVNYRFGEGLNLTGYDQETLAENNQVRITLYWKVLDDIHDNYVVFIHLRDTPNHVYAQNDSQPRHGAYPTALWESGELVLDEHAITLTDQVIPPALDLYLGLYDPATGARLPAFDAEGNPLANDEVKLVDKLVFPP